MRVVDDIVPLARLPFSWGLQHSCAIVTRIHHDLLYWVGRKLTLVQPHVIGRFPHPQHVRWVIVEEHIGHLLPHRPCRPAVAYRTANYQPKNISFMGILDWTFCLRLKHLSQACSLRRFRGWVKSGVRCPGSIIVWERIECIGQLKRAEFCTYIFKIIIFFGLQYSTKLVPSGIFRLPGYVKMSCGCWPWPW